MNQWANYTGWFQRQIVQFGKQIPPSAQSEDETLSQKIERLLARERQLRAAVDGHVREFVRTERWPALTQEEAWYVEHRLRFALLKCYELHLLQELAGEQLFPNPPEDMRPGQVAGLFLLDLWNRVDGAPIQVALRQDKDIAAAALQEMFQPGSEDLG